MSYYRALCASVPGFSAPSDVQSEASWPFDWGTTMPGTFGPLGFTRANAFQLLLRVKQLACSFEWDEELRDGGGSLIDTRSFSTTFNMERFTTNDVPVTDETQLLEPFGISETFGQTAAITSCRFKGAKILADTPDPGDEIGIGWTLDFFRKALLFSEPDQVQVPHMKFDTVTSLWHPSVISFAQIAVTSGLEYTHRIRNYVDPDETSSATAGFNASILDGHGGGDVGHSGYSDDAGGYKITNMSLSATPNLFFPWEGRWHETTGARL